MSGTTRESRYQKGKTRKVKTNLDLLEQEIVSGSGICWAICKSAPHPRQPHQHHTTQFFTGWMPFLPPNQQHQSTEGINIISEVITKLFTDDNNWKFAGENRMWITHFESDTVKPVYNKKCASNWMTADSVAPGSILHVLLFCAWQNRT